MSGAFTETAGVRSRLARSRWTAADSEHLYLWLASAERAGLPPHLQGDVTLAVPIDDQVGVTTLGNASFPSLTPVPFADATNLEERTYGIGEMAQLPNFSYSLWDWAMGNEACPLDASFDSELCHDFKEHTPVGKRPRRSRGKSSTT